MFNSDPGGLRGLSDKYKQCDQCKVRNCEVVSCLLYLCRLKKVWNTTEISLCRTFGCPLNFLVSSLYQPFDLDELSDTSRLEELLVRTRMWVVTLQCITLSDAGLHRASLALECSQCPHLESAVCVSALLSWWNCGATAWKRPPQGTVLFREDLQSWCNPWHGNSRGQSWMTKFWWGSNNANADISLWNWMIRWVYAFLACLLLVCKSFVKYIIKVSVSRFATSCSSWPEGLGSVIF